MGGDTHLTGKYRRSIYLSGRKVRRLISNTQVDRLGPGNRNPTGRDR